MKNLLLSIGLGICALSCSNGDSTSTGVSKSYVSLQGKTMGTTYSVTHVDVQRDLQASIDSLLQSVNMGVSTYIKESVISEFNQTSKVTTSDAHFITNTEVASTVYRISGGSFDPTVGPLVNAWGFGWEGRKPVAPGKGRIDSLLSLVGFDKLKISRSVNDEIEVSAPAGMQLDYSAVAKGYGVDAVCELLERIGVTDYFVEIGGEVRVKGESPRGSEWIVGVNTPDEGAATSDIYARISLKTMSMATSGNYRNFYEVDGQKVWHTINPQTGYPEVNPVLSATILHPSCTMADALATASMVRGRESIAMIEGVENAELYLIIRNEEGTHEVLQTSGFAQYLLNR